MTEGKDDNAEFTSAFAEAAEAAEAKSDSGDETTDIDETGEIIDEHENQVIQELVDLTDAEKKEKEPDPYDGMSETAIERIKTLEFDKDALQHRIDSDNGRAVAFQRKYEELQSKIDQQPAPSTEQVAAAMASDESWDDFKQEYPEIATAIDGRLNEQINTAIDSVDAKLAPVVDRAVQNEREIVESNLDTDFPGWQNRVSTHEFATWLGEQPEVVQSMAGSDAEKDAASLIGYYDAHLLATGQQVTTSPDGGGKELDEVAKRREQQLADGLVIKGSGAGVQTNRAPEGDDFSTAFKAFARKAQQQA